MNGRDGFRSLDGMMMGPVIFLPSLAIVSGTGELNSPSTPR
ncbi:MAG: hypothetical protein AVDCRST_MAG43-1027 [uncultured Thermomicrobiales bacterium]|uniref:Uncharacterized protein n=1 Tax=uncultured Thermomicrobiales bacterium TaxID=1645740 RepID=A0A6J4UIN8_9BACT|nr:MAG: hypothetical protein AVDCRST_MAG43-1027 [uncultured Thermomicrobiales bacterium]